MGARNMSRLREGMRTKPCITANRRRLHSSQFHIFYTPTYMCPSPTREMSEKRKAEYTYTRSCVMPSSPYPSGLPLASSNSPPPAKARALRSLPGLLLPHTLSQQFQNRTPPTIVKPACGPAKEGVM